MGSKASVHGQRGAQATQVFCAFQEPDYRIRHRVDAGQYVVNNAHDPVPFSLMLVV
jgi:hypothetical protein